MPVGPSYTHCCRTLTLALARLSCKFSKRAAAVYEDCRAGAQIIFPISLRDLGHVTPAIFGIRSNISSKLFELVTSNVVSSFDYYRCYLTVRFCIL